MCFCDRIILSGLLIGRQASYRAIIPSRRFRMPNVIEKQVIYDGKKIRLEVHHLENEEGKRVRREVCVHNGAVVILPFVSADRILLLRNYRYTVGQYLLE